jgi:hypothetical protein
MQELRPYLIIAERDGSSDELRISVDGIAETPSSILDGAVGSVSGPLTLGSRWTGSNAADSFEGWIATVLVDTAIISTTDLAARRDYLRALYGVW